MSYKRWVALQMEGKELSECKDPTGLLFRMAVYGLAILIYFLVVVIILIVGYLIGGFPVGLIFDGIFLVYWFKRRDL